MRNLIRTLGVACFALLLSVSVAHAVDIDLRNADNSKTPLASTGAQGAADVSLRTCFGGDSDCIATSPGSFIMTRSALTKSTQLLGSGGIPTTATDATSAVFQLPHGAITFHGVETCTGTCVQTQKIYGTSLNNTTVATSMLLCTITLNNTTNATESCTVTTNWLYTFVVTSLTSGTTPLSSLIAQY